MKEYPCLTMDNQILKVYEDYDEAKADCPEFDWFDVCMISYNHLRDFGYINEEGEILSSRC